MSFDKKLCYPVYKWLTEPPPRRVSLLVRWMTAGIEGLPLDVPSLSLFEWKPHSNDTIESDGHYGEYNYRDVVRFSIYGTAQFMAIPPHHYVCCSCYSGNLPCAHRVADDALIAEIKELMAFDHSIKPIQPNFAPIDDSVYRGPYQQDRADGMYSTHCDTPSLVEFTHNGICRVLHGHCVDCSWAFSPGIEPDFVVHDGKRETEVK